MADTPKLRVEWDAAKNSANRAKHGLSFEDAQTLFHAANDHLILYDPEHSDDEDRFLAIGPIRQGVIVVVFEEAEEVVRIISARLATRRERALFQARIGGKR